jgi:hypothetical protein
MKMKTTPYVLGLACLLLATVSCKKEKSIETNRPPVTQPTTPPSPPSTQPVPISITLLNPSFEDSLKHWTVETQYRGRYGFMINSKCARTGKLGLDFYASQRTHFEGAHQEVPWNGKLYQTVTGLRDGQYTFKIYANAEGNGMYLWAEGGAGEQKVLIKSDRSELNSLDFEVKGGVAKIGFICIDANGPQHLAPYFNADDAELLAK